MAAPIKCAVLGMGMSTTVFHVPFILALPSHFALHSILERKATPTSSLAREAYGHTGVKVVNTIEEILNDAEVEVVFVCTVNDTHYQYSKAALLAGKHVVVEKPITPTAAEAIELAHLAAERKLVLAVYQNRRFDSDFLTVKKLIAQGTFGELSEFESRYDRFKNIPAVKLWKEADLPASGIAYDLGSHLLDQLLILFGKPQRVTGLLSNSRLIGNASVPDSFVIHLHYDPTTLPGRSLPLLATARASILSRVNPQLRFTVKGTDASFIKHGIDMQEDQLKANIASPNLPGFAVESKEIVGKLYTAKGVSDVTSEPGAYKSWFLNVAEAIRAKDPSHLFVTPEQAALTIEIIEAATKSSTEGRTITL